MIFFFHNANKISPWNCVTMATRVSALPHRSICWNSHFLLGLRAFVLALLAWSLPTRQHWIARPLQIGLLSLSSPCKWFLLRKPCSEPPLKALSHPRFEYFWIFEYFHSPLLPPSPVSLLHLLPSFLWCWGQSSGTYISQTLLLSQVSSVALSSVLNATWKLFLHLWRPHLSLSL